MRISSPSNNRVIKINIRTFAFLVLSKFVFYAMCHQENSGFKTYKKQLSYADQFIVFYLLLITVSIQSHLSICDAKSHIHERCFIALYVDLLQNVKAVNILARVLQGCSGYLYEVTVTKPPRDKRWAGTWSVNELIILIRFAWPCCRPAGTNVIADI
jgi:hypothetical protein